MRIVKLKYTDKAEAIADLKAKGIIDEDLHYTQSTHSVVYLGKLIDKQPTFDDEGNVVTEATFLDGYHVDIMIEDTSIIFESEVLPQNPKHTFN